MCEHHDDHSYRSVDALAVMTNTGDAYLDYEGCLVESGEYVAALYESYAADQEYVGTYADHIVGKATEYDVVHAAAYVDTSERLTEQTYQRDLDVAVASAETEYDRWIFENWS